LIERQFDVIPQFVEKDKMGIVEFQDLVALLRKHEVKFRLVPQHLVGFSCTLRLNWKVVRFTLSNVSAVPNRRGVYAFVVEEPNRGLPTHGYVMYVGKAGDGQNSLRNRYRDYLHDQKRPKRPHIYRLLNQWANVLSFYFAEIDDPTVPLTEIEMCLNDALLPPFCKNDFSAGIRRAINAFEN
jgi:hypothetical protein